MSVNFKMAKKSKSYLRLEQFLKNEMSMTGAYQPILIKCILEGGGVASRRQIAREILKNDVGQISYYEDVVARHPTKTLLKHGIIRKDGIAYSLTNEASGLQEWEKLSLIAICEQKLAEHISQKQEQLALLNRGIAPPLSGSSRYKVMRRAATRCEACGRSNEEEPLHIDHIVPREKGGTNDPWNLQVLCVTCNTQKRNADDTDFSVIRDSYSIRSEGCPFCYYDNDRIQFPEFSSNELAVGFRDLFPVTLGHHLIIPRRHVPTIFELYQAELNAIWDLVGKLKEALSNWDASIVGFNVGTNAGVAAGQTIEHAHIHLMPRRADDMADPRGGVRGIIPERQKY